MLDKVTIGFGGDFVIDKAMAGFLEPSHFSHDRYVSDLLSLCNEVIVNLESPICEEASPAPKYGPALQMSPKSCEILNKLQVSCVSLANNHIMDQGPQGLASTLNHLGKYGIRFFGAGNNLMEASQPLILEKDDLKIAILNFAENEFSNTYGNQPGAAPLDIISITLHLQKLKQENDFVVLSVHGGAETHHYPSPRFVKLLRYFVSQGADAVVAHHTHRYNGYEYYKGSPILYGLGNFVFPNKNDKTTNWNLGCFARLTFLKGTKPLMEIKPLRCVFKDGIELKIPSEQELEAFKYHTEEVEKALLDPDLLSQHYDEFVSKVEKQYKHYLFPYTSKYLHKLYSLGLIPGIFNSKEKMMLYLNLFRCESHRDVVIKLLSK